MVTDSDHETTTERTAQCQTATVTDVTISCSGSGTAACSTQTAAPKIGCSESVTASTTTLSCQASSTKPAKRQSGDEGGERDACTEVQEWLAWPEDGMDDTQTRTISAKLKEVLGDERKIVVSDTKFAGVNFWIVTLEAGQEKDVEAIEHMAFLSQSKDESNYPDAWSDQKFYLDSHGSDQKYYFDESAGENIPVYIVDSGANLEHPEFEHIRDKVEFIQVLDEENGVNDDSYLPASQRCWHDDPRQCKSHGTLMLGFIAGAHLGVAKKVKPYLVRVPRRNKYGGGTNPEDWLNGVIKVLELFDKPSKTTLAILNLSWSRDEETFNKHPDSAKDGFFSFRNRLAALINLLIRNGVFVVTGSSNDNGKMNGWPGLYGVPREKIWKSIGHFKSTWHYIPELLVVGALNPADGKRWSKSGVSGDNEGSFPELYAPGDHVIGANGDKSKWPGEPGEDYQIPTDGKVQISYYKGSVGTSDATAYATGIAAYFLKLHQLGRLPKDATGEDPDPDMSPAGLKRYIMNNAWQRAPDSTIFPRRTLAIWNGSPFERVSIDGVCPWNPKSPAKLRRQIEERATGGKQVPLTGQCLAPQSAMPTGTGTAATENPTGTGASATGSGSGTRSSKVSSPTPSETGFVCAEDRCAPLLNCHAPTHPGCKDGKCACIGDADDFSQAWNCTEDTMKECPPCVAPQEVACNGKKKCTCTQPPTTLTTSTKQPPPPPEPTRSPPTKLDKGALECNESFDHDDVGDGYMSGFSEYVCKSRFKKMDRFSPKLTGAWSPSDFFGFPSRPMYASVVWVKGCETSVDVIDAKAPLKQAADLKEEDRDVECRDIVKDLWRKCNNGGAGGTQRVGCLEYFFKPMGVPESESPLPPDDSD
ncbi:uncharacterized protein PG986_004902 [Apiospora aurea]|uniref:Peptidase S8/S53 domain-containing protein n=1 Tax=Apiospora aurea TaxID=335848 RepID=A0ABR1QG22_9PEZI